MTTEPWWSGHEQQLGTPLLQQYMPVMPHAACEPGTALTEAFPGNAPHNAQTAVVSN